MTKPIHEAPHLTRALVTIETTERLMRGIKGTLDSVDGSDPEDVHNTLVWVNAMLSAAMDNTSATTCSLVKDQALSDEISAYARERATQVRSSVPLTEGSLS